MNFNHIKNVHFVGIGGIGMSGLAEILHAAGVAVSGCDARSTAITDGLSAHGIAVSIGHDPSHVAGVELLVTTSAMKPGNPEVDEARSQGIRILKRAELLGEIVNAGRGVGIAGTHGKTTTSAMVSVVLEEAGLDPTVIVGGMVRNLSTNAKSGKGELIVVEADEYDRSFHQLHPEIAVVTNVEADHLEYYGSLDHILESFRTFLAGVREGGVVIGCVDDAAVVKLLENLPQRVVRYGLGEHAELRAVDLRFSEHGTGFDVRESGQSLGFFKLFVPGEHNVRNALAAIAVGRAIGLDAAAISSGLSKFLGVDRRFQVVGSWNGAVLVDDYAHHPTEIRATLAAARGGYPERRIVALFQPHLYSRTRDFATEFAAALSEADVALLAPIYAAREEPVAGVSAQLIADEADDVELIDRDNEGIVTELRKRLLPNDLLIVMGAGDVHTIAERLAEGAAA
jgi:UDP-N-acetylmuramate--alanine ligase